MNPGTKLGPYEILAPLGAGGMGEVYRARDTRLKRDVALKVLPEAFARDPERMARFQREAEVLASLNHPNIAHMYGIEERALVMELAEGATLSSPLPVETALQYARQIAEALEYAHERGVVHRDLKPANVKVTPEGVVKLLDFGLAKAIEDPIVSSTDTVNSPTLTLGATRAGVILGTAAYMSPEQASGKAADRRADIWSFGAVLFEMLSGKRAFSGESVSDTLATVLKLDPDWNALPAATPASVRQLLRRCLTKDRKQRLQAIGEARIAIEHPAEETPAPADPQPRRDALQRRLWPSIAAALLVAASALAFVHFREKPEAREPIRFEVFPPGKAGFGSYVGVSPDGRKLAFTAQVPDGAMALWVRPLDSTEPRLLPGTEGANGIPFWSPDSQFLGFWADGKLKRVDIAGGPPQTLCDTPGIVVGGAWNRDGVIIYGNAAGGMSKVSAAGGTPIPVTALDTAHNESRHLLPSFLPDQRHFLYTRVAGGMESSGVYIGSLDTRPEQQSTKPLLAGTQLGTAYAPSPDSPIGRLLFLRGDTLMAQPFDTSRLALSGQAVPVAEPVGTYINFSMFSVSSNGVLAYRGGGSGGFQMTWYDRQGKAAGTVGQPGEYYAVALSRDGTRLAASRADTQTGNVDVWLHDLARGVPTRFTFDPTVESNPVWSSDSRNILFESNLNSVSQKLSSMGGNEIRLLQARERVYPDDWSGDGRFLLYSTLDAKTHSDLWVLPLEGNRQPTPYLNTPFNESEGQFSPDGHWVAYRSDENGRPEVYVQPFPLSAGGGGKFQVSNSGGEQPRWRRDGKELLYVAGDRTLMSVDVTAAAQSLQFSVPRTLFNTPFRAGDGSSFRWDISPDGQRFLIISAAQETMVSPITVVLHWPAALKK